ncbi:MAG TPA: DNA polymerase I [Trueperaceae bacterium]|nr:DNA polymerase I [Trueperaceae bacterium]
MANGSGRHEGAARRAAPHQDGLFDAPARPPGRPAAGEARRIVIIDGHALAYRSYFAMRELSTSRGQPTNAVYGFARALLRLLAEDADPTTLVVAFDAPAPTFRHERFEAYKAGRAPTPDDLPQQVGIIKRLLDLMGIPRVERPGLEADDLIGTIARTCAERGFTVQVVTSDRDALQLVSDAVTVRSPDTAEPIGPPAVEERYGVRPDQWVDYRALTGDSSDNLPGVKGIGKVAARSLLRRYGSVDAILDDLDAVEPASQRRKLQASLDALELSRQLSRIRTDADIDVDPEAWGRRSADTDGLRELLRELEFGSILAEMGLAKRTEYAPVTWGELVPNGAIGFVLDDERPSRAGVRALALAMRGQVASAPDEDGVRSVLGRERPLDACDAKALMVVARRYGFNAVPGDDPLLMAYLLDPSGATPERLARLHGAGEWGADAASRAVVTAELLRILGGRLDGGQRHVYETLERPLQAVLAEMELAGVKLDVPLLRRQSEALSERIAAVEARVREIAGDDGLNLNSRDQVAQLLFETLGLRPGKRTATGKRSTAVSALEPLRGDHEAVALILEQRELSKLKSTYLDPLPDLVDPDTGRLHTTFNQAVVATGRLSSAHPNLQNIPVRTQLGREIRRAFVAEPGARLVVADYSQIELRVLAHISGEDALIAAFERGEDVHRATAAEVFGVDRRAVTAEQRRRAKVINFGVLYGMGPRRLSNDLGIDLPEAEATIRTYFERYPRVRAYIDETLQACRERGYVETLLGRRRSIPDIHSPNRQAREYAERTAYNMPIQGTAADIMKLGMLRLAPPLAASGGRLLLQVHDELVAEAPEARADEVARLVEDAMADAYPLKVPLVAEVGVGVNWLEAK